MITQAGSVGGGVVDEGCVAGAGSGYLSMLGLSSCLDPVEPLARAVYESGWRPPYGPGPTRDELVDILDIALRNSG